MRAIPDELTTLISDLEQFLCDGLKAESLSKKAKERREAFIKRIKEVKLRYCGDDSDEDEEVDSNNDGGSMHSERTDKDEEAGEGAQQAPPVAAQDLTSVFKAGYLEKRRKDHSFFGTEWQKRWCALSHHTFYYYGSEKDKQQKGEFGIDGYGVKMNSTLRKDSKKDCCFEISAPDKRVYQFCASSTKEAEEWVKQIDFVLRGMRASTCLLYWAFMVVFFPDEEMPPPAKPPPKVEPSSKPPLHPPPVAANSSTDYANFYQGLWDCAGDHPDELSFKRGEAIYILSKEYNNFGWWVGEKNGAIGIVPRDYLLELYVM
uniref:Src kinase-associated phosphoprotein 2 n=1 Tax=Poecilia reticulata TaxID=8081 RepID=A0A3P9MWT5_POERE